VQCTTGGKRYLLQQEAARARHLATSAEVLLAGVMSQDADQEDAAAAAASVLAASLHTPADDAF
jgi:hypothetical protein